MVGSPAGLVGWLFFVGLLFVVIVEADGEAFDEFGAGGLEDLEHVAAGGGLEGFAGAG